MQYQKFVQNQIRLMEISYGVLICKLQTFFDLGFTDSM
jgi:hypothetical protein